MTSVSVKDAVSHFCWQSHFESFQSMYSVVQSGAESVHFSLSDLPNLLSHFLFFTESCFLFICVPPPPSLPWCTSPQSVLSYHGCDCCNSSDCFQLSLAPVVAPEPFLAMETCFRCVWSVCDVDAGVRVACKCTQMHIGSYRQCRVQLRLFETLLILSTASRADLHESHRLLC